MDRQKEKQTDVIMAITDQQKNAECLRVMWQPSADGKMLLQCCNCKRSTKPTLAVKFCYLFVEFLSNGRWPTVAALQTS